MAGKMLRVCVWEVDDGVRKVHIPREGTTLKLARLHYALLVNEHLRTYIFE